MKIPTALLLVAVSLLSSGCSASTDQFPEDQVIRLTMVVDEQWQTIEFASPLELNRRGLQRFHIVVSNEKYDPNLDHDLSDSAHYFDLFREANGAVVSPDVILLDNQGNEVKVTATGTTELYEGRLSVNFGMFDSASAAIPPYPEDSKYFVAARLRSNLPFEALHFRWHVDRHPDIL